MQRAQPPEKLPAIEVGWEVDESLEGDIDRELLSAALAEVLAGRGFEIRLEVGLVITDDLRIRELNRRHRGVDAPTDVLSFPLLDYEQPEKPARLFPLPPGAPLSLGDIVISYPRAVEQSREYDHSLSREMAFLVVHGAMHLLGYDHEDPSDAQEMRRQEEAVLQRLGLGREA